MNTNIKSRLTRGVVAFFASVGLVIASASTPVSAAVSPVGTWDVGGTLTISVKVPRVILSTTSLNAKSLGMTITYAEDGTVTSTLLGLGGTWTQSGSTVNLDLSSWIDGIKSSVSSLLPAGTAVNVSRASFTAKVISASKMTGNVKVIIDVVLPAGTELGGVPIKNQINGRVMISGALTNTPAAAGLAGGFLGLDALTGETMPVDVLNRVIGSAFLYQLITK